MLIPLEGNQVLHAQAEADRVGITLEHFFLGFVTHTYRNRVTKDEEYLRDLAKKRSARACAAAVHDCDQLVPLCPLVREIMYSTPSRLR
jgi:hypothetical protein